MFKTAAQEAYARFQPAAMLVGASCTAELIQDDPGGLALALNLPVPVVPLELPSYQRKENWGAAETFYQLVRTLAGAKRERAPGQGRPRCNVLGPTALGYRHRDDLREICGLLEEIGIDVNVVAPLNATPADLARLQDAEFNVVMYPEIASVAAGWLQRACAAYWRYEGLLEDHDAEYVASNVGHDEVDDMQEIKGDAGRGVELQPVPYTPLRAQETVLDLVLLLLLEQITIV